MTCTTLALSVFPLLSIKFSVQSCVCLLFISPSYSLSLCHFVQCHLVTLSLRHCGLGRRHVQTVLVEPSSASLNSGDVFILVTERELIQWVGAKANIMEKAKVRVHAHARACGVYVLYCASAAGWTGLFSLGTLFACSCRVRS